jgi:hypothetical protein
LVTATPHLFISCLFVNAQVGEDGIEAAVAEHIVFVPDRPFNDVHYHLDSSKLARLGWVEEVAWDDGLKRTLDWCVHHVHARHAIVPDDSCVHVNLPELDHRVRGVLLVGVWCLGREWGVGRDFVCTSACVLLWHGRRIIWRRLALIRATGNVCVCL